MDVNWDGLPVALLDTKPDAVTLKDESFRYVWVNAAFEALFGVSRNDLIGRLDKDALPDRTAVHCCGNGRCVLRNGAVQKLDEAQVDLQALLERADASLYAAKAADRYRVVLAD